jgi:uncharacterized repeat protein (TIGR01451 family)
MIRKVLSEGMMNKKRFLSTALPLILILGIMTDPVLASELPFAKEASYSASTYATLESQTDSPPNAPIPFQITFAELGYDAEVLESPLGQVEYAFRLPENWKVAPGGVLDIEFSYFFTELVQREDIELQRFGEVSFLLDGSLLGTYALDASTLERVRWRIALPSSLLNETPGDRHEITLALDAWFLCDTPHKGKLIIHPESVLSINYTLIPPALNLAHYPRPFAQWSFNPDSVWFVLPEQPSVSEIRTAAVVAAGLGDLAGSSIVISTTTDVEWLEKVDAEQADADHLFVIGQPGRNQLLTWLGNNVDFSIGSTSAPIAMERRQLALSSHGPGGAMPGEVFTYTISVTNTTSARVRNLTLTDYLPHQTDLVNCVPDGCRVRNGDGRKEVYWSLSTLAPEENLTFSLRLQLADTPSLSLTVPILENLAVLTDRVGKPINASALSTSVGDTLIEAHSSYTGNDYFFIWDGQAVFEEDGIVQEILSPWNPQQVILLITGLSDQAVLKAGQTFNSDTGLLDIEGPAVLVREIRPSPPVTETWISDFTLADLGYKDRTTYGFYPRNSRLDYFFDVPRGWYYTNQASLTLFFDHSEAIDAQSSTLSVLLNGSPLTTIPLNQNNALGGSLQVDLPSADIKAGTSNRLSILPVMQIGSDVVCQSVTAEQAWLKVSQESSLYIEQRIELGNVNVLDLDDFPFPFDSQKDMSDVLFALPSDPELFEVDAVLQTAFTFGRGNAEGIMNPMVFLGNLPSAETLRNYDIVAIGRPTRNPLIQEINTALPQPFIPGTDEVENQLGEVLLRLPPDIPLGYIQEIPSPWNQDRALLAVTGNRDEGLVWATYALNRRTWALDGDLVLAREAEGEVETNSIDTRRLTSSGQAAILLTAVPELTPVSTPTVTPTLESASSTTATLVASPSDETTTVKGGLPVWVLTFVGITATSAVVLLAMGGWRFWRQRK